MAAWYNFLPFGKGSLWPFGSFPPFWYVLTEKNLATQNMTQALERRIGSRFFYVLLFRGFHHKREFR
jgi:hypothetical protein